MGVETNICGVIGGWDRSATWSCCYPNPLNPHSDVALSQPNYENNILGICILPFKVVSNED